MLLFIARSTHMPCFAHYLLYNHCIIAMRNVDFVVGYMLPGFIIAIIQTIACYAVALIIGAFTGVTLQYAGIMLSFPVMFPSMLFFVCAGLIFGSLFSDKAAPGLSSIIISLAGFTSGAWIPLDQMGSFGAFCRCLPFYPAVLSGRRALQLGSFAFDAFGSNILIVSAWCILAFIMAVLVFGSRANRKNG